MKRLYENIVEHHVQNYRQMVFLVGARQVGKTTISKKLQSLTDKFIYLNWDDDEHQKIILSLADGKITGGNTALHFAVLKGHAKIAKLLLKKGADPNKKNSLGITPLGFALLGGRKEMLKLLLNNGANPNLQYKEDKTLIGVIEIVYDISFDKPVNKVPKSSANKKPILVFDEIHKYYNWRNFLKGFFDIYEKELTIVVTGSARLDIYSYGGDSLMGRYFPYRVHPLSVAEIVNQNPEASEIRPPQEISNENFTALIEFGGFPEVFTQKSHNFYKRWLELKKRQLFNEDIKDLTKIHEIAKLKILAQFIEGQVGGMLNYSSLAKQLKVADDTVQSWISALESVYYCYIIRPWHKNIKRALIKQPKIYLWDWAQLKDIGARNENIIANHLLKAIHLWNDSGFGKYGLYFIRDKQGNEVDFLVSKDDKPWFLVEVKTSKNHSISKNLYKFQEVTKANHAFQIAFDMDYINQDCFCCNEPTIVPAKTFLSQLV